MITIHNVKRVYIDTILSKVSVSPIHTGMVGGTSDGKAWFSGYTIVYILSIPPHASIPSTVIRASV